MQLHQKVLWAPGVELHVWALTLTCADARVGDDGGVGPLVGARHGERALVHALHAAGAEGHEADAARHLRHRRAAGHRTCGGDRGSITGGEHLFTAPFLS